MEYGCVLVWVVDTETWQERPGSTVDSDKDWGQAASPESNRRAATRLGAQETGSRGRKAGTGLGAQVTDGGMRAVTELEAQATESGGREAVTGLGAHTTSPE